MVAGHPIIIDGYRQAKAKKGTEQNEKILDLVRGPNVLDADSVRRLLPPFMITCVLAAPRSYSRATRHGFKR